MTSLGRILAITHGYYPRIGGAERVVTAVSECLAGRGYDVTVLTRRLPGTLAVEIRRGVTIHRLPAPAPKALGALSFVASAVYLAKKLQPEIIHAHELISPSFAAVLAKPLVRCPVVATVHRSGEIGEINRLRRNAFGRWRLKLYRRRLDAFITLSQAIDSELASEGIPDRQRIMLPNGIDTSHFIPASIIQKADLRSNLGLPVDAVIAIYTGRLAPEKRLLHLVKLWPEVVRRHPKALLLIVGSGSEDQALRENAGKNILMVGSQPDVAPYLQSADLFVLPSIAEGISLALLEAGGCALPAVACAIGGNTEIIAHEQTGLLAPASDLTQFKEAVISLLDKPEERIRLGACARRRIEQHYSFDQMITRLIEIYTSLLAKGTVPQ